MKKKLSKGKLVKKLDAVFSEYVRKSNADSNGICTCVTCDRQFYWKQIQAGHFMSRKHYSTRWDLENVKPQCPKCNVFNQGEQYKYSLFLGKETAEKLLAKSRQIQKFTYDDIETLINQYKSYLKSIKIY